FRTPTPPTPPSPPRSTPHPHAVRENVPIRRGPSPQRPTPQGRGELLPQSFAWEGPPPTTTVGRTSTHRKGQNPRGAGNCAPSPPQPSYGHAPQGAPTQGRGELRAPTDHHRGAGRRRPMGEVW